MASVRYEIVSHACLLFEFGETKILTDPWLIGSTNYRSWWHFPKPSQSPETLQNVDLITISHIHPDHFHTPSLKKFPKTTPVWIPKLFFKDFYNRVKALGFENILEMRHGKTYPFKNTRITNYSYRADDSLFVFEHDNQAWIHFNDCLAAGKTLQEIIKRHPRVHTAFEIYANAESYPYCYESEDPLELQNWDNGVIVDSFLKIAQALKPKYAVPYAGFVGIFHRDGCDVNPYFAYPSDVVKRANETRFNASEIQIMGPGDCWSSKTGFQTNPYVFENREKNLQLRSEELKSKLEEHYAQETPEPAVLNDLKSYFDIYFKKTPAFLRDKLNLKIAFELKDLNETYVLNLKTKEVKKDPGLDADVRLRMSSYLLKRTIQENNWLVSLASYQVKFSLKKDVRSREVFFWMTVYLLDAGYFSFENYDWPRVFSVAWDRRTEFGEYFSTLISGQFVRKHLENKYNRTQEISAAKSVL